MNTQNRDIRNVGRVVSLAEADEVDLEDWMSVSIVDKIESLERIRQLGYALTGRVYPQKMDKTKVKKRKNRATISN